MDVPKMLRRPRTSSHAPRRSLGGDTDPLLGDMCLGQPQSFDGEDAATTSISGGEHKNQLGTFRGVFVPCIVSMFGVILFLRVGFTVGHQGLLGSVLVLGVCSLIVVLTAISICCVSTNGQMRGGGIYYMLARSLGPEFGGSIGVIFFIANLMSAALYLKGMAEQITRIYPDSTVVNPFGTDVYKNELIVSTVLLLVTMGVCFVGASLFASVTMLIFVIMEASLVLSASSFVYEGLSWSTLKENLGTDFLTGGPAPLCALNGTVVAESGGSAPPGFFAVFSVFFNGVTGFNAGANMSGDLQEPGMSIPLGTLSACAFAIGTYLLFFVLMAASQRRSHLICDNFIMQEVAFGGWPTVAANRAAIVFSLFGSATMSIVGGSRILQALARDDVINFLRPFGAGTRRGDEPYAALILSWVVVQSFLFIGNLDTLAPFTTLSFLLSYTTVNFACFVLTVSGAPNFRPSFRAFGWQTGLLGVLLSFVTMVLINSLHALIAVLAALVIFYYISLTCPPKRWGSIQQAIIFHQVRKYLLRLDDMQNQHVKYWRPGMLTLTAGLSSGSMPPVVKLADELKKGGVLCLGAVVKAETQSGGETPLTAGLDALEDWTAVIRRAHLKAFPEVVMSSSLQHGVQNLMLSAGLGGLRPHTLLLSFPEDSDASSSGRKQQVEVQVGEEGEGGPSRVSSVGSLTVHEWEEFGVTRESMVAVMHDALFLGMHTMLARRMHLLEAHPALVAEASRARSWAGAWGGGSEESPTMFIDVWSVCDNGILLEDSPASFSLSLLSAWIMTKAKRWRTAKIRVLAILDIGQDKAEYQARLEKTLKTLRIKAEVCLVPWEPSYTPPSSAAVADDSCTEEGTERIHRFNSEENERRVSRINKLIREWSTDTALVFIPIARPPSKDIHTPADLALKTAAYTQALFELSEGLPPVLLVAGVHAVMTTQL